MQPLQSLLSSALTFSKGRSKWALVAILVVAAPLIVVAAVRKGADAPKPETADSAAPADAAHVGAHEKTPPLAAAAGGGATGDPELLAALSVMVAEPQAPATQFDDSEMVAALDAAVQADVPNGPGAGPSVTADGTGGGASAPPAPTEPPMGNGTKNKKDKKDKKTAPPAQNQNRRSNDHMMGAFEGGRDPNMSALESALEIQEKAEEIEQEEKCKQDSSDPACNPAAVPLPAALPLLASGAVALGFFRRRRRKEA